jgi:triacylglycerol lipase
VFAGLAPARRRLVVALLTVLAVGVVSLGVILLVPGARGGPPRVADQSRPGPVLLVPGYGGSTGSLRDLAAHVTAAGRDATVVSLPGDGTGDLAAAAQVLDEQARAALDRTGADSVDLIGYSAGGVIARLWVRDEGAELTRRVVTLGSPHHGTNVADLVTSVLIDPCPEACRQLTTGSDLLRRLNAGDETPAGPAWVSIWTTQDQTVTPPDSASLSGATNLPVQSICANAQVSHGDLPRSALVREMVLAALAPGEPMLPTAADCARLSAS